MSALGAHRARCVCVWVAEVRAQPDPRVKKDGNAIKKVYLVTIPHPRRVPGRRVRSKSKPAPQVAPLNQPGQFSRPDIEKIFLDAAAHPMHEGHRSYTGSVDLQQMAIFMELHKPDPAAGVGAVRNIHYHIALQAARSFRFQPVKRAIRLRHGLETNWSCDHEGYHSAVGYGALPSPEKPQAELDPQPRLWAKHGIHTPLLQACEEPVTMAAIQKRRERAVMKASEGGKADPRPTQMDLYAAIVGAGIKNTPDSPHGATKLIAHLKKTSFQLYTYAFKIRSQLSGFINDVWSWESAGDTLSVVALPRVARLARATGQVCSCGGMWPRHAQNIFRNNSMDPAEVFTEIHRSLSQGRGRLRKSWCWPGSMGVKASLSCSHRSAVCSVRSLCMRARSPGTSRFWASRTRRLRCWTSGGSTRACS